MSDSEILEIEKYWCEKCSNWDKEQAQMDGYAKCKLTGTLCFAQESGKECKCFNVPSDRVVILPDLEFRQTVYMLYESKIKSLEVHSYAIRPEFGNLLQIHIYKDGFNGCCTMDDFGKTVFLTKEEAENARRMRENERTVCL